MASFLAALILVAIACAISVSVESIDIGVCYGTNGDNLPTPTDVVGLYKRYGIGKIRLFEPTPEVLEALKGSQIAVSLGVRNQDTPTLAASPDGAQTWFSTNVQPYINDIVFEYISVGNEVIPGEFSQYIAPAMQNLQQVLIANNVAGIKVTTVVSTGGSLGVSFPPSAGAFSDEARAAMTSVLQFLSAQGSPLMINVYPYFAYASDPANINLDYALFNPGAPIVQDGDLSYSNMFDAIVDAFYSAMEKEGVSNVGVVVSESGWPSDGNGNMTTPDLASTYNKNFMNHIMQNGTPKRPQAHIEGYIFEMFEEDLKPAGVENHFGLFHPNMEPVYPVFP